MLQAETTACAKALRPHHSQCFPKEKLWPDESGRVGGEGREVAQQNRQGLMAERRQAVLL